jgi:Zn-finger nucleic acid-binding protein
MNNCPVCDSKLKKFESRVDRNFLECPRCGPYSLSGTALTIIKGELERVHGGPAIMSHALYQMTKREQWALISSELLKLILENTVLPKPSEQLANLILWLGEAQPNLGAIIDPDESAVAAAGVVDFASLDYLIEQARGAGLIDGNISRLLSVSHYSQAHSLQLTMHGWQTFSNLQLGRSSSQQAFMAMKFGDKELDMVYKDHFKVGVTSTGFSLKRLDEGQPAGLIDDRLRVEIRQSRFLIADLTHQNQGAYWEAGFAEGLGKPVIYTCRKDVFEDRTKGTHFDTNHHLTVVWELDKLDDAVERLKATIRATLPDEAKINDLK